MTAKEYLQQIRKIDILINNKQEELETLQAKAGVQAIRYDSDGSKSASRDVHKQERLYLKIIEVEEEINQQIDRLVDTKKEVMALIDTLDSSEEINVLYMRYFQYMKWEEIALKMNFSYMHIHRIHGKALQSVQEKMLQNVIK